jgi:hypothetical protein
MVQRERLSRCRKPLLRLRRRHMDRRQVFVALDRLLAKIAVTALSRNATATATASADEEAEGLGSVIYCRCQAR